MERDLLIHSTHSVVIGLRFFRTIVIGKVIPEDNPFFPVDGLVL